MTKQRRTINLSIELDNILGILSSASQQNLSEFIEIRLRENPEINEMVKTLRTTNDPKPMVRQTLPIPVHTELETIPAY